MTEEQREEREWVNAEIDANIAYFRKVQRICDRAQGKRVKEPKPPKPKPIPPRPWYVHMWEWFCILLHLVVNIIVLLMFISLAFKAIGFVVGSVTKRKD